MGYRQIGHLSALVLDAYYDLAQRLGAVTITTASAMSEVEATKAGLDLTTLRGLWQGQAFGWVRFVTLGPSQQIVGHVDAPYTEQPFDRYHIPVATNRQCWSFADGVWQHLPVGGVYGMDPTAMHGAVNWGATPRVHLLVDVLR